MTIKRAIKRSAGWASVLMQPLVARASSRACILVYHRVAPIGFVDPRLDDWNVPPSTLERQISALTEFAEFVPLAGLPARLADPTPPAKPLVALTFDDGYANFFHDVLPILRRYAAPATVFPVTSTVGRTGPLGFDGWSRKHASHVSAEVCQPLNWHQLEACVATDLVTVGSHSHQHLKGMECTHVQLLDEALQSRTSLQQRLGAAHGNAYAYPYGSTRLGFVHQSYVDAVKLAGYEIAVTSDLGLMHRESDAYLLPRIEANSFDVGSVLRAKVCGALAPYYLVDRLRRVNRAV